jgi:hypothetical protein
VKRGLTIGLAIAALGATVPLVIAGTAPGEPVTAADAMPAYEILTTVRELGLDPISQPLQRGPYYVLHAIDPLGVEMRVVADAQLGDILSVTPARPYDFVPYYFNGPRIIEVPRSSYGGDDALVAPALQHHRGIKPRPKHRSEAPPAPAQHRPVLSAPPRTPHAAGPSPIYPTPKYGAADHDKAEAGEKFSLPDNGRPK